MGVGFCERLAAKKALSAWLNKFDCQRFVTLATNDPDLALKGYRSTADRLTDLLKEWEGRVRRKVLGPKWSALPYDGMPGFYVIEKPWSNPHWHGLIQFRPRDPSALEKMLAIFDEHYDPIWRRLVPRGTATSRCVFSRAGAAEYIAKSLACAVSYQSFVLPGQFSVN